MGLPSESVRGVDRVMTCLCRVKDWLCVLMVSTVQCISHTQYWRQSCKLLGMRRPGVNFQARTQVSCEKRLLASSSLFVCPHRTVRLIHGFS
jgi:hypothetical protein